ncbi:minor capsid protein [Bacillus sp. B15-48]|uniref:minor capsid protein n=1 Tax=Bacillus sp. B15-48 TaxID=1548601 RepID=UPI001940091C|nr:minor capsid protein [Bacillus sp. B15-48]MBM4762709.1 capsid protein [Bacillus sp. B15-48]
MAVRINIKKDLKGVSKRVSQMTKQGQYAFANQVHADSNLYAPRLSSDLRNQSNVTSDNKQVVWNVPYARRQYYNYGAKFTTPGTGPKWDSKALAIHGRQWVNITKKAMK